MTTIEARQSIVELLSTQAKQLQRLPEVIALNSHKVNWHIDIIKKMGAGRWNPDVANDYIKLLEKRLQAGFILPPSNVRLA